MALKGLMEVEDILVINLITISAEKEYLTKYYDKIHRKGYLIKSLYNYLAVKGLTD